MNITEIKKRLSNQSVERISKMIVMSNPESRESLKQVMEMCFEAGWEAAINVAATLPAVELIDILKEKKNVEG